MDIHELIKQINESMEQLDLVTTRKLIESNMVLIKENRHYLKRNARAFLEIIESSETIQALNRNEMITIGAINAHASNFDINGLKLLVKNNPDLLMRTDINHYLNTDAKAILSGMNIIQVKQ